MISTRLVRLRTWIVPLFTALIIAAVFYFLYHQLRGIDFRHVVSQAESMPLSQIGLSVLLMLFAYWALTAYEFLAIRYVGASVPYPRIAFTAFLAYAVGHNVGFASLSGGAMRYRMYSLIGLSATQIALVILFGVITFGLGLFMLMGVALLIEPATMWVAIGLSTLEIRLISGVLLSLVGFYLVWSLWLKKPLLIKHLMIKPAPMPIVAGQFLVSAIDLTLAASVLYVLLPAANTVSFIQFLPIFLIGIGLGVLSSVPGGVGVFETVLLLAMPAMPAESLLSAILVYRVIYYLIPLSLAMVGFVIHEIRVHRQQLLGLVGHVNDWLSATAPLLAGGVVFIAGSVLLFSGASPAIDVRLHYLKAFLPLPLVGLSHLLGSVCGIMLLILSRGLFKRLRGVLPLTLVLLFVGMVVSLAKGADYEEAIFLLVAMIVLWSARDEFYRSSSLLDERFTPAWILSVATIVGISIWIGAIAYHYLDYNDQLWWQFAFDADAPRMLRATLVVLVILVSFLLWKLIYDAGSDATLNEQDVDLAVIRHIVQQAPEVQANLALLGDKLFLLHPDNDAFIMYQTSGNSWIAMGDPVGNPLHAQALVWQFRTLCDKHNARPVFYQVSETFLPVFIDMGLSLSKLGEEGRVPLQDFSLQGKHRSDLRQAENRFKKYNAVFEVIPVAQVSAILPQLQSISDSWLQAKAAHEKHFSLGAFSADYMQNFDIAVVKVDNVIVAFANLWQGAGRCELSLDLMRFSQTAPKSTMDYLFTQVMLWGKAQGYQHFSLGMAPLSGLDDHALAPVWHKIGTLIFRYGEHFYNFEGLRHYKEKYQPEWRSRYIASPSGLVMPAALLDTTRLISGGVLKAFLK